MEHKFKQYISDKQLFNNKHAILVAVSGGIDSIVLLHLLHLTKIKRLGILHCNFQLRGKESDNDESFVLSLSKKYNLPFFVTRFHTKSFARLQNLSIQEAARVLRYRWFESIRKENNYDLIAVGHNKNDIAETFLFNLLRGTGTDGLTGIKPLSGKIVRPLLFASREEIKYFAREAQLLFREDSSNRSEKYARNFIRHRILPSLQKVNIQAIDHIVAAAKKIDDTNQIALETIRNFANKIVIHHHDKISVSVKLLLKQKQPIPFLYFILKDFGFNPKELPKILEALNYPGRQFHSSSHSLFTGRDFFYIYPKQNLVTKKSFRIETLKPEITEPINLAFSIIENTDNFVIKKNNRFASFDYDKIIFPLIIRKWKNGDSFYPLGMKKKKKLSDFFIDEKIPIPEKEAMWLLETDGAICWLIGKRIDDRFKVTPTTKRILQIEMTE